MLIDIPYTKVLIRHEYLQNHESGYGAFTEAYIFAATAIVNRPLLFTAHTIDGAVFSRLPIHAFTHDDSLQNAVDGDALQPWGCLGSDVEVIQHQYLKDYLVKAQVDGQEIQGIYKMTFDFKPGTGFQEDPEQHKTMNMIALKTGQFALLPNNSCLFLDRHFTEGHKTPNYKRQSTYWYAED